MSGRLRLLEAERARQGQTCPAVRVRLSVAWVSPRGLEALASWTVAGGPSPAGGTSPQAGGEGRGGACSEVAGDWRLCLGGGDAAWSLRGARSDGRAIRPELQGLESGRR